MLRYAITDRKLTGDSLAALLEACLSIVRTVDFVQIRERDLSARELEWFCRKLRYRIFGQTHCGTVFATGGAREIPPAKVLVNHRVDVALGALVDGVHLRSGPGELTPAQVRLGYRRAGRLEPPVVSVSVHSPAEAARAAAEGADCILFGPVFGKAADGHEVTAAAGLDALREAAVAAGGVPVLALGGVTADDAGACVEAGAAGVAGIRLFFQSPVVRDAP